MAIGVDIHQLCGRLAQVLDDSCAQLSQLA